MADKVKLITAQEAAKILRQNKPDKIYLLVRSKCLSGFKCGKRWLIDEDSVYKYINRCILAMLSSSFSTRLVVIITDPDIR